MKETINNLKRVHVFIGVAVLMALAACNSKSCRCYLLTRWGNVVVEETYIDQNTACAELGYSTMNAYDSSYRYCTDIDTPPIDTMDIVRRFWGK